MGKIAVDANVLIGYLNRDLRAVSLIETLVARGVEIIVPAVVVAELAGLIRTKYPVKLPDALIAATAQFLAVPLCTFDTADFRKIQTIELFDPDAAL